MGDQSNPHYTALKAYVQNDLQEVFTPDASGFNADYKTTKAAFYASSDDEMKNELDQFTNFCESNRKFNLGHELPHVNMMPTLFDCNLYNPTNSQQYRPPTYQHYTWKQEAMTHMMKSLPDKMYGAPARKLIEYCCLIYLKAKIELNLRGECELTHYSPDDFKKLRKTLEKEYSKSGFKLKTQRPKQDEIIKELKTIVTKHAGVDASKIGEKVVKFAEAQGIRDNAAMVQNVLNAVDRILNAFENFITLNNVFYQLFANLPGTPKVNLPVRKFVDGKGIEFILVHEFMRGYRHIARDWAPLLDLLKKRQSIAGETQNFGTMLFHDFAHSLPTHLKTLKESLVLVITPIPRTDDHRPIPVPVIGNKYGILATDAFVDFLRYLISVMGIFQVIDDNNYKDLFDILYSSFNWVKKENLPLGPMFIELNRVNISRNVAIAKIKNKFGEALRNVRELKPVGNNGFTLDDLVEEIRNLKLDRPFKQIIRYGRIVYDRLVEEKTQKDLTMHDKYTAMERFQMYSIVEQDKDLYRWFREQRAYHRYPFYQMKIPELAGIGSP
ncbi:hypothetical protein CAEBREN_15219 [Caenorhabditis brenneri]|uniref:DUF7809 domain-containing protein n=1 Tax=Caenorhabditis brenneri TaxID=135651 RepID=G0NHV6_CAEBE|nr:hypothetical protein CAEBREN_15219 [Caenorhabditis brenneri]